MQKILDKDQLVQCRDKAIATFKGKKLRAWMVCEIAKKEFQVDIDESTIRGKFIEMGMPLSGGGVKFTKKEPEVVESKTMRQKMADTSAIKTFEISEELKILIPRDDEFTNYVVRGIDKRLALHYNIGKYPLTQGKQGTGKTFSHMYYAWTNKLPFFLISCSEDFRLTKLFGDKTIKDGSIMFREGLFVKLVQSPSIILFDEINAVSNANTYDFHALLQNRELFIRDADDGNGRVYGLHPECRIGFAQNPKSCKYIGGNIKQSNFLGRCTYLTYPEFTKGEIELAILKKFPGMDKEDVTKFNKYYFAIIDVIERSAIPCDISIRQLNNVVDLWLHGLPLKDAIEDGLASILEAISQPKAKESFMKIAEAVWKELMKS